ncbi:MAG TPA: peptidase M16 [Saprospirales bacterium]|nr:insulinase family protein [Saprospiraceae bacterium]HCV51529.1 peptidase M16 [Saprospirales bacterium]MDA9333207.1 insulinase family protein [Saprospiraceae bacterium]MDA9358145.1 insulinase family protein [Saprospiraceae bacterium]MDA9866596.1 insulinase family protein [Saprospiraceae bacterium]
MIAFEKYVLDNGLRVILHQDASSPMAVVNVAYDVGSRDEEVEKTGFAHLFEHLMFGGSANIPDFDTPIQMAGGENNAFTNCDMTNFYNILPAENIETALWLESDRMMKLDFSSKSLATQQKVVIEEFKETCLNQPYGDMWHHLSDMAYKEHSYRWPTIGLVPEHIQDAKLGDVEAFFYRYYRPNNAVLVVVGNIQISDVKSQINKYFSDIPAGIELKRLLPVETKQSQFRSKIIEAAVPLPSIIMAFGMCNRLNDDYYAVDLLSDILANGRSSRFFVNIYKKSICSTIDAFISGTFDPGLFIVEARPMPGVSIDQTREVIWNELNEIKAKGVQSEELEKIRNKTESSLVYSEVSILHKAMNLAYYEILGDAEMINIQSQKYQNVTAEDIKRVANEILSQEQCNEIIYLPK